MKAITTKYMGPTNTRGARVVATDADGHRATVSYDYALSEGQAHHAAAVALAEKMGWPTKLCGGSTKNGYAFVFTDSCSRGGGMSGSKRRRR